MAPSKGFQDLLSTKLDDIEKPKAIPQGTYQGVIKDFKIDETKNRTPLVRFNVVFTAAGDDVDADALTTALRGKALNETVKKKDFFLSPDAQWRLKEVMQGLGISTDGRSLGDTIPEMVGKMVLIEVTERSSEDGKELFSDINKLGPIGEG